MTSRRGGAALIFPFVLVSLIWGSSWIVIRDQLVTVPPAWSVTYRYAIGSAAMFLYAFIIRKPTDLDFRGHGLAAAYGLFQFFLNFNLVYAAEQYVTSGVVAMVFALLLVPNSILGSIFLKRSLSGNFVRGSVLAVIGVLLLLAVEIQSSALPPGTVATGIGYAILAMFCSSASNVMQATNALKRHDPVPLAAWGMLYGSLATSIFAWVISGPPVFDDRLAYLGGLIYLGLGASALAFTLYITIIRKVGPGLAAYTSVLIPIIAMTLSAVLEDFHLSPWVVAGVLLAVTGMIIALRGSPNAVTTTSKANAARPE